MSEAVQLESAWRRLVGWLEGAAPASHAALRPPASAQVLSDAAAALGGEVPDELVRLLRLNDGAQNTAAGAFLPRGTHLLSAEEIVSLRRGLCGHLDTEELIGVWWHQLWVPFAATHDTVGCLFVDTRPGPCHGAVGYFFHESGGESGRWPSLAAFAGDVAGAVEETRPTRLDVPRLASAHSATPVLPAVQDGALSWRQ